MHGSLRDEALAYHEKPIPGKTEVVPTKPCVTQWDLSLAYTPGVAAPCLEIEKDPSAAYRYTNKGNLVAVVSNGTAVLGLGDIGALSGKPVMEGKGVLFKRFAGIDVFDLEVASHDPDDIIRVCKLLEPTFGGINLEDIKAPDCFYVEETLKREMEIPVFHDDQHGTAIISGAALQNAMDVTGKDLRKIRIVFSGAGASAIATARLYVRLGVDPANILLVDSKGTITKDRTEGMNPYKAEFAGPASSPKTLAGAMKGADVFVGLSVMGLVTQEMVRSMADRPVIFALANPDPEISYPDAKAARPDAIVATGRSDYPNQVNNVLGFPFVFRGALDVRARAINEEMKIAACRALADLAKENVPDSVSRAYGEASFQFGPDYVIPKPFDYRVLLWETTAVARAAMETGVARRNLDLDEYRASLEGKLGRRWELMNRMHAKAKANRRRVVYPDGADPRVLRAVHAMSEEGNLHAVLLGKPAAIETEAKKLGIEKGGWEVVDPTTDERADRYAEVYFKIRYGKGVNREEARRQIENKVVFGSLMVRLGDADGMVAGIGATMPDTIRPVLQVIGLEPAVRRAAGLQIVMTKECVSFFADTVMNVDPTAEELAEIALLAAGIAREFNEEPVVAMLSFSNFGSVRHPASEKVQKAVALLRAKVPDLVVDGEIQADLALMPESLERLYPVSRLVGRRPNVFIFPDLNSANISYKLIHKLAGAETIGPIMLGLARPVQVLQPQSEAQDIQHMTSLVLADAHCEARGREKTGS
jgi:malate dehydrogenase (oxaloacetate-decarboxylating)(NADP+)